MKISDPKVLRMFLATHKTSVKFDLTYLSTVWIYIFMYKYISHKYVT